jgi:transcriptional regulator with XRE-family HTH domain
MTVNELRSKRVAAEISATLLAAKARLNRSRLSNLERGYSHPRGEELQRLSSALEQLIESKTSLQKMAAAVGWPLREVR